MSLCVGTVLSSGLGSRLARRGGPVPTCSAAAGGPFQRGSDDDSTRRRQWDASRINSSSQGAQAETSARPRPAHPAWRHGPKDTPLRATNRDLMLGLLTERAAKTLLFYFSELNPTLMQWLEQYLHNNPIPREGNWEDVSGETFLRRLLSMPLEETRWDFYGRDKMYAKSSPLGVDPRQIAQRIMDIRSQIAREWIEELRQVSEENAILMRETAMASLAKMSEAVVVVDPAQFKMAHPEMVHPDFVGWQQDADGPPDNSATGSDD